MDEFIKETLRKQLQLLSEQSEAFNCDLPALTHAMVELVTTIVQDDSATPSESRTR